MNRKSITATKGQTIKAIKMDSRGYLQFHNSLGHIMFLVKPADVFDGFGNYFQEAFDGLPDDPS